MIIRFTIHDNNFSDVLKSFAIQFYSKVIFRDIKDDVTTEEIFEEELRRHRELKRWQQLLCDHDQLLAPEDKEFVCNCIRTAWNDFVDKVDMTLYDQYDIEDIEHTRKYFKENFEVEVVDGFREMWENSEVCYYFTTAQMFIIQ